MADPTTAAPARAIGASPPRLEAADKASGRARYVDDIRLPGMLHAALADQPACARAHRRLPARRGARDPRRQGDRHRRRPDRAARGRNHQGRIDGRARQGPLRGRAGRRGRRDRRRRPRSARRRRSRSTTSRCQPVLTIDAALADDAPILHEEFAGYVKTHRRRRRRQRRLRKLRHRGRRRRGIRAMRRRRRGHLGDAGPAPSSTWRPTAASPTSTRPAGSRCT